MPCLSDPDSADRAMLSHCLQLSSMLLDFLHAQQQQQQLPPRLAQLFDASVGDDVVGGAAGRGCSSLREGLQVGMDVDCVCEGGKRGACASQIRACICAASVEVKRFICCEDNVESVLWLHGRDPT